MNAELPIAFSKPERDTFKALMDALCRAYGASGDNKYGANIAKTAVIFLDKIEMAEAAAAVPQKPELVKTPTDEPIAAA